MKYPLGQAFADAGLSREQVAEATGLRALTVHNDLSSMRTVSERRLAAYADVLGITMEEARRLAPGPRPIAAARLLRERRWTVAAFSEKHGLNASAMRCVLLGLRPAGPRVAAALEAELGLPVEVLTAPDSGDAK